jgi:Protein kinase domain
VIREVASALDHLHGRTPPVLHRALTPENVLLTAPDGLVKLLGVGEADRPRIDAVRAGYQSPESLADIAAITARADVFVLASLAFEALTGRHAFSGTSDEVLDALRAGARPAARDLRDDVPAAADAVLHRCWALSPEKRPATAGEAARALSAALGVVDTGEVALPDEPTGSVAAPLRVVRRRNALLGPTVETPAPDLKDPRSFLENVERTEVSTPAVPSPAPVTARAEPAPKPSERPPPKPAAPRSGATLRSGKGALNLAPPSPPEAPQEPTDRNVETKPAETASPARAAHDTLDTTATPEAPSPVATRVSPFADDPRATLQTTLEALQPAEPPPAPVPHVEGVVPTMQGLAAPPSKESFERPATGASTLQGVAPPNSAEAPQPVSPKPEMPATLPLPSSPDTLPLPTSGRAPQSPAFAPLAPLQPSPAPRPSPLPPPQQPQFAPSQPVAAPRAQPSSELPEARPITRHAPQAQRAPDAVVFPDEPTGAYDLESARPSPWRSPWVIASIFLANAIVIVGVAHAIALAASREPMIRVVQGPAPVCAACAPCPIERPALQPQTQTLTPHVEAPPPPQRPTPARRNAGIIRDVPAFGPPRRR